MNLIKSDDITYSSLYLVEQINTFRTLDGNKTMLLHYSLLAKIESELQEDITAQNILVSEYKDKSGKSNKMYLLTYKQALQILLSESRLVRVSVIAVLEAQQQKINELEQYNIPQTYSQALMLAAKQAEQIELQERQLLLAKPKVDFYDAVADSKDAIDLGTAAKVLDMNIGRNHLFEFLRDKGILMGNNQPYQKYVDCGYFRVIEQKYTKPDGSTNINIKTLVYQKGMKYIKDLYHKSLNEQ